MYHRPAAALQAAMSNIQHVRFDINNVEHVQAFARLIKDGRQHPTLRFTLEAPFLDVRSMLTSKVTHAWLEQKLALPA